jgi:hypothetical protein
MHVLIAMAVSRSNRTAAMYFASTKTTRNNLSGSMTRQKSTPKCPVINHGRNNGP